MKTYKIFNGKIVDVSKAIDGLYKVRYTNSYNIIEEDWLYAQEKLGIGDSVKVFDSDKKYIRQ